MNTNSVKFFETNKPNQISEDLELILAVWEIINPGNVGQIIRMAHNVGVSKVLFINDAPNLRESKIKKTAGFSFDQMQWQFISKHEFLMILNSGFKLAVLETCNDSINIFDSNLPGKLIILAGNESHGIPVEIIKRSNLKIYIPMPGNCKSMNVSHALTVAAFEWYRQKST